MPTADVQDDDLDEEGYARPAAASAPNETAKDKPWIGTIESAVPSTWGLEEGGMPPENTSAPDATIALEWLHGYDTNRNNLRYLSSGEIAYHAANCGVVYSKPTEEEPAAKQRFSLEHTDDIASFALHPNGKYIATGELGAVGSSGKAGPKIIVWDAITMQQVGPTMVGFHTGGVQHLDYSPDGNLLASVGMGGDNDVAIYNKSGDIEFSGKSGKDKVLDCVFSSAEKFVTCGNNHIYFWTKGYSGRFKKNKGCFGQKGSIQPLVCLATVGSNVVSGTASGHLYFWEGRSCIKAVPAHTSTINSLFYQGDTLVSGGKDGFVKVWSSSLKEVASFNIADCGSVVPKVRSVCMSDCKGKILVGTKGSEIFEIDATTGLNTNKIPDSEDDIGSVLIEGHFKDELWGLAMHPSKPEYATVGDDHYLRIWCQDTHKCLRKTKLDYMSRTVAYSPGGDLIALGFGGGGTAKLEGSFLVLKEADLEVEYKPDERFSKNWARDIKFSPDGKLLAIGSADNSIYLHNVGEYDEFKKCDAHSSYIAHFDFSEDSVAIQSTSGDGELLYFVAETGEQNAAGAAEYKDLIWASQTCPVGWPVQGIWGETDDGTDYTSIDLAASKKFVAVATEQGNVKLHRYPCLTNTSESRQFGGHSSHITNLRFGLGDTHLISVGGNDQCVFQWKIELDEEEEDGEEPEIPVEEEEPVVEEEEEEEGEDKPPPEEPESDIDEDYLDGEEIDRPSALEIQNSEDLTALYAIEAAPAADDSPPQAWVAAAIAPELGGPAGIETPDSSLELEWVHGYRAQDVRNNLFYNAENRICYPAASVGIIFDKVEWTQVYNKEHTADVVCLAMSADRKLVATGQTGQTPLIVVWDACTGKTVGTIKCGQIRAATQIAFSNSGRQLAVVGQDDNHTLFIYNWRDGTCACKGRGGDNKVMAVSWSPDDKAVVTCGVKSFRVWKVKGRNLNFKKGIFGKACKIQPLLSIGWLQTKGEDEAPDTYQCVLGAKDGSLCKLDNNEDGTCGRKISDVFGGEGAPHDKPINAIFTIPLGYGGPAPGGIITGDDAGKIQVWDNGGGAYNEPIDLNAPDFLGQNTASQKNIRAVCMDEDGTKLLVGTKGSEIYEFDARSPEGAEAAYGKKIGEGPLVRGHCKDELWGLAIHPTKAEYCTVGDDRTVRVWDLNSKKLLKMTKLNEVARAVAYSPDGALIAVGLGGFNGRGKNKFDGAFEVLAESDLGTIYRGHESHEWIQEIKFSPDGNTLALGSHDNKIYLHSAADWSVRGVCEGHTSFITHFDFSEDSAYVQSNCDDNALMFFDANTGEVKAAPSEMKDTKWSTQTCPLGWPVSGVWPAYNDGTQITAVDRSRGGSLLVTVDDYGKTKIFPYPCTSKDTGFLEYRGNSSHTTNARFTNKDTHIITTGGNDRCVFQWRHVSEDYSDEATPIPTKEIDPVLEEEGIYLAAQGDEVESTMAVQPWKGCCPEPDEPNKPEENTSAPELELQLEWVHGYRSQDTRNNLFYNCDGDIVYSSAGVGICFDKSKQEQKHYLGHDDDVVSLAVSADGRFVATGQKGTSPLLHVWDASSCAQVCVLPRFHKKAIPQVAFSPDGSQIVSVGQDDDHSVCVWETATGRWIDGKRKANVKGSKSKVLFAKFTGLSKDNGDYEIITGGDKHVNFYNISCGDALQRATGVFGKKGSVQSILCSATVGGHVVTGTESGAIYAWDKNIVSNQTEAHTGSVNALFVTGSSEVQQLVSGGKDGTVCVWSAELERLQAFNLEECNVASLSTAVRSVCCDADFTRILVGTYGAEIYEIQTDGEAADACQIVQGHYKNEVWGLAMHPTDSDIYATCGDDASVRVWSLSKKRVLGTSGSQLSCGARALAWSPDGSRLAVGMGDGLAKTEGKWLVFSVEVDETSNEYTLKTTHEAQDASQLITDMKFSPDGEMLAVASKDSKIYLYSGEGYDHKGMKCEAHNSPITHFDFTADGTALRSNCAGFELLIHNSETAQQDPSGPGRLKNDEWASESCTFGWGVQGIWEGDKEGINAVDRSNNGDLLIAADEEGAVSLYNYPAVSGGNGSVVGKGHSQHITNAKFNLSDEHVVTTGGSDRSVFQWKLSKK